MDKELLLLTHSYLGMAAEFAADRGDDPLFGEGYLQISADIKRVRGRFAANMERDGIKFTHQEIQLADHAIRQPLGIEEQPPTRQSGETGELSADMLRRLRSAAGLAN